MPRQRKPLAVLSTRDADVLRLCAQVAEIRERIGARIRDARKAKKRPDGTPWRQGDLARALPGHVEASSVSRWENGKVKPGDDTLEAIAKALDVDVSYFYADEPEPGTADLMGALSKPDDDTARLKRIEAKLDRALAQQADLYARIDTLMQAGAAFAEATQPEDDDTRRALDAISVLLRLGPGEASAAPPSVPAAGRSRGRRSRAA